MTATVDLINDIANQHKDLKVADYNFRGISTHVSSNDKRVIEWIDELMLNYRVSDTRSIDIEFNIIRTEVDAAIVKSIIDLARPVYICKLFSYWEYEKWRILEVPDKAFVIGNMESNKITALINEECAKSPWIVSHYVFYPIWVQLLKKYGIYHIHAAGVSYDGHGLLIPGPSGCGKSTLSLNLVASGFNFLGDDTVFLKKAEDQVDMMSFPEEVKICKNSINLFPELNFLNFQIADKYRPKYHFDISEIFPNCLEESAVVKAIVLTKYEGCARTVITPIPKMEALTSLFRYSLFMADPISCGDQFDLLADLAFSIPCFQASIGLDNDESSRSIMELVRELAVA